MGKYTDIKEQEIYENNTMSKTIISIVDREEKLEVAHIVLKPTVTNIRTHAVNIAKELGYYDLLKYRIWVGNEQEYNKYIA